MYVGTLKVIPADGKRFTIDAWPRDDASLTAARDAGFNVNAAQIPVTAREDEPAPKQKAAEARKGAAKPTKAAIVKDRTASKAADHAAKPTIELRPDGLKAGSAAARLVDAVSQPTGATMEHLREVVGWSRCDTTLRKACATAGLVLTVDRSADPAVYHAK